jgi:uncharacterized protein YycO
MMAAGDLLLVRGGKSIEDRIIMFGTHSVWSHVAIVMDASGQLLAEATHTGIAFAHIDKYANAETHLIDVGMTDAQRVDACRWTASCIGQRYSRLEIAAIALAWLTHGNIFIGSDKRETCSSYASRHLEHGGTDVPKAPPLMSPGDLSAFYAVMPRLGGP